MKPYRMHKTHWWHCTSDYHGESFVATRRQPKHKSDREPVTPRLCVAPSIAECFAAVLFADSKPVYCYRTEVPRRAVAPRDVWDQVVTRERWLIPPVVMTLRKTIASLDVAEAQSAIRMYHQYTRQKSSLHVRVAQLAIASRVLGPDCIRDRAKRCCQIIGIDDPEDYLLERMLSGSTTPSPAP